MKSFVPECCRRAWRCAAVAVWLSLAVFEFMRSGTVRSGAVLAALGLLLVLPEVQRLRRMNSELRRLQAVASEQAESLELRNAELQAVEQRLRAHEADLIANAEQLKERSEGSDMAAKRFEGLFQGLSIACIGFDAAGVVYEWNRASTELFGYQPYEALHQPMWRLVANARFARSGAKIVKGIFEGREHRDVEWEVVLRDGSRRHILGSVFPIRALDGTISCGVAACLDVTGRKVAEDGLRASEQLFRDLIDSLQEGVLLYDQEGKVKLANKTAARILGLDPETIEGWSPTDLLGRLTDERSETMPEEDLPFRQASKSAEAIGERIVGIRAHESDSEVRQWLSITSIPLRRPREKVHDGVLSSFSDITDRLKYQHLLESLATTDGLTGLVNRRAFQERLEAEVAQAREGSLALVMVDVDHFKQYNDAFGHPEGDGVLRQIASILKGLGTDAVGARYGGEEFAVIVPRTSAAEAVEFASNLCAMVANAPWPKRQVTISAGVAMFGEVLNTPDALITAADLALYASKAAGRNRASAYDPRRRAA